MAKKLNPRLVQGYRPYKIVDIARLFHKQTLHEKTVRGWITKSQLPAFKDGSTYYVYGEILVDFLTKRNASMKNPLAFNEFSCFKCKKRGKPKDNQITLLETGFNGCIKTHAICNACGYKINRSYKAKDYDEILKTFGVLQDGLQPLCDSACSTLNTHPLENPKTTQSEPMLITQNNSVPSTLNTHPATPCTTLNTHPKPKQTDLFT